jgi:hypothetical protein
MGVIDKCTYTLSCDVCAVSEVKSVLDKGSCWSGSSWGSPPKFSNFNVSWNGDGGRKEPGLVSATCRKCGKPANIESKYSV